MNSVTLPAKIVEGQGARGQDREAHKELDKLVSSGAKPTISDNMASSIANQIHTAMDGYGTDEDSIIKAFKKIKNDADFLKVETKYGIRSVSSGRFNL